MSTDVNATISNSTVILEDIITSTIGIPFNSVGFIVFFSVSILMLIVFIMNYKKMVYNKKLLYSIVIFIFALEEVFQIGGIVTATSVLVNYNDILLVISMSLEQSLFFLSTVMIMNCLGVVTKILYELYFNKSHEWMRMNKNNERAKDGVKISSITLIVTLNLFVLIVIPFVIADNLFLYYDTDRKMIGEEGFAIFRVFSQLIFGIYISIICLATVFFPILNMVIVILLIRKLILNQKFPITEQRRKSCRKLLLLTFGQLYLALLNMISMTLGGLAFAYYIPLYPICLFIHKIALILFCVMVTFSFGPLDFVMIEFDGNSSQQVTNVEIIQKRDDISKAALNSDIVRREDYRTGSVNSETQSNTSELPILVDQAEVFTEIPLWERKSIFSLSKPSESIVSQL